MIAAAMTNHRPVGGSGLATEAFGGVGAPGFHPGASAGSPRFLSCGAIRNQSSRGASGATGCGWPRTETIASLPAAFVSTSSTWRWGKVCLSSYSTGLDRDRFDPVCDHLIVENQEDGRVVGTYRMQSGLIAAAGLGYYSAQEFEFSPYECIRDQVLELGRASIDRQHRSSEVLTLLWRGIAQYAKHYVWGSRWSRSTWRRRACGVDDLRASLFNCPGHSW